MNEQLYHEFLDKRHLDKERAPLALAEFIASFEDEQAKGEWVREFLNRGDYGHKIRHEIYRDLIFPLLLCGFRDEDSWAIYQLSRTIQNVYDVKEFWKEIGCATKLDLLEKSYFLAPSDEVRRELLQQLIQWFDYCQHEWPSGILFGNDGASPEQCQQLLDEIAKVRNLDKGQKHQQFLDDFEDKVRRYQQRLIERDNA